MSYSLGELEALCRKAARGAGFSWGMAEEAGFAVRWLHARGFDGAGALADALANGAPQLAIAAELSDGARAAPPPAMQDNLLLRPYLDDTPATHTRAKIAPETYALLDSYAQNTYAPATEASRLAGAGAGLTDND